VSLCHWGITSRDLVRRKSWGRICWRGRRWCCRRRRYV